MYNYMIMIDYVYIIIYVYYAHIFIHIYIYICIYIYIHLYTVHIYIYTQAYCIYLVLATPSQGFPILERQDGGSKLPLNAAAAAGRWNWGLQRAVGSENVMYPLGKQQKNTIYWWFNGI